MNSKNPPSWCYPFFFQLPNLMEFVSAQQGKKRFNCRSLFLDIKADNGFCRIVVYYIAVTAFPFTATVTVSQVVSSMSFGKERRRRQHSETWQKWNVETFVCHVEPAGRGGGMKRMNRHHNFTYMMNFETDASEETNDAFLKRLTTYLCTNICTFRKKS